MTRDIRINADFFDKLDELYPDYFDLVLTDPPYDLTERQKEDAHQKMLDLCIYNCTIIVFSPPENQWVTQKFKPDQYLFWIKPISTKNTSRRYSRFVEMMFVFHYGNAKWKTGRHWSQYTNVFMDLVDNSSLHPYRKPPSLIERLILNHTDEGDWILDPFAGSFVVADVAKRLGRNCVSIEKEAWT